MTGPEPHITRLLQAWRSGDAGALDQLMPLVYEQLHTLASRYMRRERSGHTLGATALVHEAYLKLLTSEMSYQDRTHFQAIAAMTMRRILVDRARNFRSARRGSGVERVALDDVALASPSASVDVLDLDAALNRLTLQDERKARLVELTYFGGMNAEEAATVLGVSTATVNRELKLARAWLQHAMTPADRQKA